MHSYVLIPGAGGALWYWHRVAPLLREVGHEAIVVGLPGPRPDAGLPEYTDLVAEAIGGREDVVLVAAPLGGFAAPVVAQRVPGRALVLVNAMIPVPGETPGAWWGNTGSAQAREAAAKRGGYGTDFDLNVYFLHDVPPEVIASGEDEQFPEADAVFGSVCNFTAWPDVPIRVLAGTDDRFFPVSFQQQVARDRLRIRADILPGGHLIALAQPGPLADYLVHV